MADPKAFPRFGFCILAAAWGCGGPAQTPSRFAPVSVQHVPAPRAPGAGRAARRPVRLDKAFTGQAQPSLLVKNGFPIAQHVFLDWLEQAVLAPAASQRFEVTVGAHTLTCADSTDPDDNPAAVTESFETGYAYSYEIR